MQVSQVLYHSAVHTGELTDIKEYCGISLDRMHHAMIKLFFK